MCVSTLLYKTLLATWQIRINTNSSYYKPLKILAKLNKY
jgi:hypothetical protein